MTTNDSKIVSFSEKESIWGEFLAKAKVDRLDPLDVLRAAMRHYISGRYDPSIDESVTKCVTERDVIGIVHSVIRGERILTFYEMMSIMNDVRDEMELKHKIIDRTVASLRIQIESLKESRF
jgi:hypothetical protein